MEICRHSSSLREPQGSLMSVFTNVLFASEIRRSAAYHLATLSPIKVGYAFRWQPWCQCLTNSSVAHFLCSKFKILEPTLLADLEKHQPEKYLHDGESRVKQPDLGTLTEGDMVKVGFSIEHHASHRVGLQTRTFRIFESRAVIDNKRLNTPMNLAHISSLIPRGWAYRQLRFQLIPRSCKHFTDSPAEPGFGRGADCFHQQ